MKIRPNMDRREFLQTTALAASALPFLGAAADTVLPLERSLVCDQLKRFAAEKKAQAIAAAQAEARLMLPEFKALFAAAEQGDWPALKNIFQELHRHAPPFEISGPTDWRVQGIQSKVVQEIYGALENIMGAEDDFAIAFGNDIIGSLPPGSIYLGGTDPGRFVITALSRSHVNGDPFFTLTQNALADRTYLKYARSMYGARIYIPTDEDSTHTFSEYVEDADRRRKENKLRPGEDIEEVDGKLNIRGQVAVMTINGLLARLVFDKNPDHEFYIEESFPLEWMYPHLVPHGLVMKINRQPLTGLSDDVIRRDHGYWTHYIRPMIGDWLRDDTPVGDVVGFIEKVHVRRDLCGFKGDPRFIQNEAPQRAFSKLRSSIGGIYAWRADIARSPAEKKRMLEEADFAFRQAVALCPRSPEALFRYSSLLAGQGRTEEAVPLMETALNLEPKNVALRSLCQQLKKTNRS
jgi:tetratricopeptide (TPR) repeat protein